VNNDKRFLVGLAGTDYDRALVRYARQLADTGIGTRFEFVQVVPEGTPGTQVEMAGLQVDAQLREAFRGSPAGVEATSRVVSGIRTDTLIAEATQSRAGVILIGHRRSRSGRRSLARRLAMVSPCSVWLVPEGAPGTIQNPLAPVDFSDNSADALRAAASVGLAAGVKSLRVLHVSFDSNVIRYDEHISESRVDEKQQMQAFLAAAEIPEVPVTTQFEEGPDTARVILRVAAERGSDLIVMCTRGRSRAASVLIGSVTARVMAESPIAVLAVKHFGAVVSLFDVLTKKSFWESGGPKTN